MLGLLRINKTWQAVAAGVNGNAGYAIVVELAV